MTNVLNYKYKGNPIAFDFANNAKMINATQMAKVFNKRPSKFLELPSTKRFIEILESRVIPDARKSDIGNNEILTIVKGGNDKHLQGTWMHEKLALKFAAWLSPEFELWIFDRIQELLTTGKTELQPKTDEEKVLEAMTLLTNKIQAQKQQLLEQAPQVQYYKEVLQSDSTYTVTQIAKDLGMTATELNRFLHLQKIQFKQSGQWVLYKQYQDKGYTDTKTVTYPDRNGNTKTALQTRWTNKGREFICNLVGVEV